MDTVEIEDGEYTLEKLKEMLPADAYRQLRSWLDAHNAAARTGGSSNYYGGYGNNRDDQTTVPLFWSSKLYSLVLEKLSDIPQEFAWSVLTHYIPTQVEGLDEAAYLTWLIGKGMLPPLRSSIFSKIGTYQSSKNSYGQSSWFVVNLTERNHLPGTAHSTLPGQRVPVSDYHLREMMEKACKDLAWGAELNCLLEYLDGEGKDFEGTFDEYLASDESKKFERRCRIMLYSNSLSFWPALVFYATSSKNPLSLNPKTTTKKQRQLIRAQERSVLREAILTSPSYSKGATLAHTEALLAVVKDKLGIEKLETTGYGPKEFARGMIDLLSDSMRRESKEYNPYRLISLLQQVMPSIPSENFIIQYLEEYSSIYDLLIQRLDSELEVGERFGVEAAAGFIFALFFPQTWIRGKIDNGPFLFHDMLEATEGIAAAKLLGQIALGSTELVPTETEWRRAIGKVDFSLAPEWVLTMTVTSKAENAKRTRQPDAIIAARRALRHKA